MSISFVEKPQSNSPMRDWLAFSACEDKNRYRLNFYDRHIGNPILRSLHGGVTVSMIEMSAQTALTGKIGDGTKIQVVSSSVDFLRVTKDADLHSRTGIIRISRRLAFVEVYCWQDAEDMPVARGTCTLRIFRELA